MSNSLLTELKALDNKKMCFQEIGALLEWDQEVYMPEAGAERRADQSGLIAKLGHEVSTNKRINEILTELGSTTENPRGDSELDLSEADCDYLRLMRRNYDSSALLPSDFIEKYSKTCSLSQSTWVKALKNDDFNMFVPHFKKVIELTRQMATFLKSSVPHAKTMYDVLLDLYEPGITESDLDRLFEKAVPVLSNLTQKIHAKYPNPSACLTAKYDVNKQDIFCRKVMKSIGYDVTAGRLDLTVHPFTTTLGSRDVRITTNYHENLILSGLFSVIHEGGHGMYEQHVSPSLYNTSAAEGTSMGIHESQSRMWENMFARSHAFWEYWYPQFQEEFFAQLKNVSLEEWYKAVNYVTPSLRRTEADEVTYSLHIVLRYRIEKALINGDLEVEDVPKEWNKLSKELFGIVPQTFKDGCLQDVHWSAGLLGYFPSYALGNFYGAQFLLAMKKDGVNPDECFRNGDTKPLISWLTEHIWKYGALKFPGELLKKSTGEVLQAEPFLDYLKEKYV